MTKDEAELFLYEERLRGYRDQEIRELGNGEYGIWLLPDGVF